MIEFEIYLGKNTQLFSDPIRFKAPKTWKISELQAALQPQLKIPKDCQIWIIRCTVCYDDQTLESILEPNANTCKAFLCCLKYNPKISIVGQIDIALREKISTHYCGAIISETRLASVNNAPTISTVLNAPPNPPAVVEIRHVWDCKECTLSNSPAKLSCEVCNADRPADYVMPPENELTTNEQFSLMKIKLAKVEYNQFCIEEREETARQAVVLKASIMEAERDHPVYWSEVVTKCEKCSKDAGVGESVILRQCTHRYCKECIVQVVNESPGPKVLCNIPINGQACGQEVLPREIRGILSEEEFNSFQDRLFDASLKTLEGAFRCLTKDCRGVVITSGKTDKFKCDVCKIENCVGCRAQHNPLTCEQYKAEQIRLAANKGKGP